MVQWKPRTEKSGVLWTCAQWAQAHQPNGDWPWLVGEIFSKRISRSESGGLLLVGPFSLCGRSLSNLGKGLGGAFD